MEKMLRVLGWVKKSPLWVYPLLISMLLFFPADGKVDLLWDGEWYRGVALNISQGRGLVEFDWQPIYTRPAFPVFMAIVFKLFGVSTKSAFVAARVFFVGNVLLLYFVGERFYNKWVGLVASLFALTSVSINVWSAYIHLDHILPFFVLLALLLTYLALEKQSYVCFALAGAALGVGYLVKEMALLFFPLPVLAFLGLKDYRRRENVMGLGILLGVLVVIILPWMVHVYHVTGRLDRSLGGGGITMAAGHYLGAYDTNVASLGVGRVLTAFVGYYQQYLRLNFALAPLFVLAWGFTLGRALWKRERASVLLSLALLLFTPMIIFQGTVGLRARQGVILFLLSFVALANLSIAVGQYIRRGFSRRISNSQPAQVAWSGLSVALVCLPIVIQAGWEDVPAGTLMNFVAKTNTIRFIAGGERDLEVAQKTLGENSRLAGEWLTNNAPSESAVMAGTQFLPSIYFYAKGIFPFHYLHHPLDYVDLGLSDPSATWHNQTLLFLWVLPPPWVLPLSTSHLEQRYLHVLTEDGFLSEIREKSIDYVITDRRHSFIGLYLMDSPGFQKVAEFGEGDIAIFEVVRTEPSDFETHVDAQLPLFLGTLREQNPERYQKITSEFLEGRLGWKPEQVQKLLAGELPTIEANRAVQLDDYVALCESRGSDGISSAIARHQEAARSHPHNPWPYIILGALYEAGGSLEQGIDAYQQALALEPGNVEAQIRLIPVCTALVQNAKTVEADQALNEACVQALEGAIERNPDDRGSYWNLATLYDDQGRIDEAIAIYRQVTARWPNASAYARLGRAYKQQGDIAAAIAAYEEAVSLSPNSAWVHLALAQLYQERGETDRVINGYETVIALNSNQGYTLQAYLGLAALYENAGDMENALVLSQEAVAAFPDSPDVHLSLARVYEALGRVEEAIAEYERVIELDPPNRLRQEAQRQLEKLTNIGG